MKEKVQAPELRFDGFTDDWELRKLTNITSSYSGLTYSPTDIQDTGTFVLRSSNVKNDQLIDADNVYVNPDIVNSINVKVGDVIIVVRNGSRALIGKHAIVNEEMPDTVIGAFMSAFRGENGNYINALLSTDNFQKEVHKSLGATINQITGKDFSMMIFPTPKFGEQQKIGAFFKQLDYTIALHQRKLDLLKEQKKGYLQKMFPKNGAKVPELRFAGFADDWEERKAKEMIKTHHFRSYLAEPNDVGNYEVIQQGDKPIAGYANGEPFEYFYDVTLFGDHTVSLFKPTKPFFIATDGVKIISADEFDGRYFYVTLERYKPASQGYKRHFTILKNEDIWFTTNKDEQVKIGTFFKQLDDIITLHQRKLDLLKEQKKGFLQKMFV